MPNSEPVKRYSGVLRAADSLSSTITLQVSREMFAAGNVVTGGVYVVVLRDRDITALETCIGALESLRIADGRAQGGMRARLDNYEASDWRQKEEIAEQAKMIERLRGSIEMLDTLDSPNTARVAQLKAEKTELEAENRLLRHRDILADAYTLKDSCAEQAETIARLQGSLDPEHKCKKIAQATNLSDGRESWIGELTEPSTEWPGETHCWHITTPAKYVVFLLNRGDFEQDMALLNSVLKLKSLRWLETVTKGMINAALEEPHE